jgi:hypothetical protein
VSFQSSFKYALQTSPDCFEVTTDCLRCSCKSNQAW